MPGDALTPVLSDATAAPVRFVAYYRVSTERQGRSGLGLDAQRDAVSRHVAGMGGAVLAEDAEVIVPPRGSAVPSETAETAPTRRD